MCSDKEFVSHQRVSSFPESGVDLWGRVRLLPGRSGELLGNLWITLEVHSSGEVAGELLGKLGETLRSPRKFPGSNLRREKKYTPKVFSAPKTQVPQQAKKRFGVYTKKLVVKGKEGKKHIHQTAFQVCVCMCVCVCVCVCVWGSSSHSIGV